MTATNHSSQTLSGWWRNTIAHHSLRRQQHLLIGLQCCKDILQLAAFGFFAAIAHQWIILAQLAELSSIIGLSCCLLGTVVLTSVLQWLREKTFLSCANLLERRLLDCFARQQHATVRCHHSFYWQTLWLSHIPALARWHCEYRVQQAVAVLIPLIALGVIGYLNWVVALSLVITLPVVPLFMVIVGKGAARLHQRHFAALTRLGGMFVDRLVALPVLATFSAHTRQSQQLDHASQQLNRRTLKVVSLAFLSNTVLDFFSTLAVALIAVFIGFSLLGEVQIGPELTLFSGLWLLLIAPFLMAELKALGQFYHQKAEAEQAYSALEPLFKDNTGDRVQSLPAEFVHLTLDEFSMTNPELNAKKLDIHHGDWIRLCGQSGAGKTALLDGLAGWRPASHYFSNRWVMLTQQPVILPSSLRANLCLGRECSDYTLWQVLHDVDLYHWAKRLPAGLDTLMGEHPPLSGGQAQRLAIARLVLISADIWLLDEPTAHLDEFQQGKTLEILRRVCKGKTVIWCSHKPLPEHWFNRTWTVRDKQIWT